MEFVRERGSNTKPDVCNHILRIKLVFHSEVVYMCFQMDDDVLLCHDVSRHLKGTCFAFETIALPTLTVGHSYTKIYV